MERLHCGISGSRGFLGGRLAERLEQYIRVTRLDRSGELPGGIDIVYDLAAYGNYHDQKDPQETYRANVMRVLTMLDQANQDQMFILTSSNAVKLDHKTYYTASKLALEGLAQAFTNEKGLKIACVRPFSITGIGEQKRHLIPKLIDSCLNGTQMPFVPEPAHDFLDVDDFVDALLMIAERGQMRGEVYEIGSGKQYTNQEVREIVEDITGNSANVEIVKSMRSYDSREWRSNNGRIASLGWEPKKDLRQSIEEMIDYARKNT